MTDRYAKIREALEAGPTPGPWVAPEHSTMILDSKPGSSKEFIAQVQPNTYMDTGRKNRAFITACDPDTIRELLEERDRLLQRLDINPDGSGIDEIDRLKLALRALDKEEDRFRSERDALAAKVAGYEKAERDLC